ncbi:MAG: hypothetical protein DBX55_01440 [Verrucomicrobia bacterium]|nr:MAG: hypothetical protein DBX55_01440 [Verrucomicrobiota bacterium]
MRSICLRVKARYFQFNLFCAGVKRYRTKFTPVGARPKRGSLPVLQIRSSHLGMRKIEFSQREAVKGMPTKKECDGESANVREGKKFSLSRARYMAHLSYALFMRSLSCAEPFCAFKGLLQDFLRFVFDRLRERIEGRFCRTETIDIKKIPPILRRAEKKLLRRLKMAGSEVCLGRFLKKIRRLAPFVNARANFQISPPNAAVFFCGVQTFQYALSSVFNAHFFQKSLTIRPHL